jgi:two-component sensor histidine kinase
MTRIPFMRRAILAERPLAASVAWLCAAVAIPTAIRWVVDQGASGIPFVTYFPAVLLATIFLGWRFGALTALASAVIANRLLREAPILFYVSMRDAILVLLFALACTVVIWVGETLRRVIRQQEEARLREELLKRELLHRVRNLFAVVQSLASLTYRHSNPDDFLDKFTDRLIALSNASSLLGTFQDRPGDVPTIVVQAVEAFRNDGNITSSGPPFEIQAESVVPLSLALYELCTNASKYGSLSVPEGRVIISWERSDDAADELCIRWQEVDGPRVEPPVRKGLGSVLLRPQAGIRDVRLDFAPSGLTCDLRVEGAAS